MSQEVSVRPLIHTPSGRGLAIAASIAGWYGMASVLGAYVLSNAGLMSVHGFAYEFLNCTGAAGLLWISALRRAYPAAALNLIWTLVALVAIAQSL